MNLSFKAVYFIHNFYGVSIRYAFKPSLGDLSVIYFQQNSGQSENQQSNKMYVRVIYSIYFIIITVVIDGHLH